MSQRFSAEAFSALLDRPMKVITYRTIDSTNTEARRLINNVLDEPALLVADKQTAGKGRIGHWFYSPADTGLYMSIVLQPQGSADKWLQITSAAAVAVCLAIESLTPLKPAIKWVNDIYLHDQKVGGILTEAISDSNGQLKSLIIGIGINLTTASFPEELFDGATSLYLGKTLPFTREALAAAIVRELQTFVDTLQEEPRWLPLYRERAWLDGKEIVYYENDIAHAARAIGIDDKGGLIIEAKGKRTTLTSGEITVRLN